jgi:2-polyprenyl-6-methoxyphenol hydroxylase-like FAD-dependent oxidoreductase
VGSSSRRALVIGGSVGGLFAALLLRRRAWYVQVFERATEALSGRGAGIVTHPELDRVLELAGVGRPTDLGIPVARRVVLARDGRVVARHSLPQVMTSWDRLWRLLRDALPDPAYVQGAEFIGAEEGRDGVVARFADGSSLEADLLVGADGLRSAVRAAVVGEVQPLYAGYTAWRGLVAEAALPPEAHRALFDEFAFCLPRGEQMLGYPVAGPDNDLRPGHRRYNWVWYRPADEQVALPGLLTDINGHTHSVSIPPPLIRSELVEGMRAAALSVLAPPFGAVVAVTPAPFLQPIYDLESPHLAVGRSALIGDAAFVARPHVGAGTTKAAEDALALADALEREATVSLALERYEQERRPAGQRILRRARHLGAYMQAHLQTQEEQHAAARHHSPEAVLEETAVLTF